MSDEEYRIEDDPRAVSVMVEIYADKLVHIRVGPISTSMTPKDAKRIAKSIRKAAKEAKRNTEGKA